MKEQFGEEKIIPGSEITKKDKERIYSIVERLEGIEGEEGEVELLSELFRFMEEDLGITISPNVNDFYDEMERNKYLIRLERLSRIMHSIVDRDPIEVGEGEGSYANAVTVDGLKIAMSEGEAPGPVRTLIGLGPGSAAVGFDPEGLSVQDIDSGGYDLRDVEKRVAFCRHIKGKITSEKIKYIIFRTPVNLFPEEMMTSEEKEKEPRFILRGAKIEII